MLESHPAQLLREGALIDTLIFVPRDFFSAGSKIAVLLPHCSSGPW